jgi:Multimeric flavodoxin WrbA
MKVLLINGSPKKDGCTFTALSEIAARLATHGVESEFFHLGTKPISGCIACFKCREKGACSITTDSVNECREKIIAADALVVGSPVYFAGPNGALCALLDRVFFSGFGCFKFKPAAAVASCRRGGSSASFDRLNKYFTIANMPVVSSQYWNSVHGNTPDEVRQDAEGLQTMRTLADNMAWMLKSFAHARGQVALPHHEDVLRTNFIR